MVTIDRERLIGEKQNNKASPTGVRLPKETMLLRDIFKFYKAIPGRVLSFWTHQQGLPRAERSPNSINVDYYKTD